MATGLFVDEHQVVNNNMYDPDLHCSFNPNNRDSQWWDPANRTTPIWTANEIYSDDNCQRHSGSIMFPGADVTFHQRTPTYLLPYDRPSNWTLNIDTLFSWLTDPHKPANFVSLYFDQPDDTAHRFGPWDKRTLDAVKAVDNIVGYLMSRLNELAFSDRVDILFVSDHGMAEVSNLIFLDDLVDIRTFKLVGQSPIYSVFVLEEFKHISDQVYKQLEVVSSQGHFKIFRRDQIPASYHYSKSARVGDFFILVDKNYEIFRSKVDKKFQYPEVWGNHGWTPTDSDMRPLFMALGPSFKQSFEHTKPFDIIDMFPLMVNLLDLPSDQLPNNGTLSHVINLLERSALYTL